MTLNGYAYEIMELLQKNLIDDFYVDIRLVKQIIKDQRELAISNAINKGGTGGQDHNTSSGYDGGWDNYTQSFNVELAPVTYTDDSNDCTEFPRIWKSVLELPEVVMMGRRPAILRVIPLYDGTAPMKSTILFSSHDRARYVGNGRFNTIQVVGYVRDDYLWLTSQDTDIGGVGDDNINVIVDAILRDPTEDPGFNEETDEFPIGKLWPYMQEPILRLLELKLKHGEDKINDATNS